MCYYHERVRYDGRNGECALELKKKSGRNRREIDHKMGVRLCIEILGTISTDWYTRALPGSSYK